MNKLIRISLCALTIVILSACGKPTLDTSSDEAMKESVQRVMADLSADDQERFKEALAGIYILGAFSSDNKEEFENEINTKLNGMTAEEVFQLAEELKQSEQS